MNEFFKRHTEEFLNAARSGQVPENFQALARESLARTREAYDKMNAVAKDQARTAEEILLATQAGAKAIGARVLDNANVNTAAAFEAAQAIAGARSLPEAARLQAEFVSKQLAAASEQTRDLFELSTRLAQETMQTVNQAAARSFEQTSKSV